MYVGSCLCGNVRYEVAGELSDFGYCHCSSCQKASGTAHGANASVDASEFTLQDPAGFVREFESSPGKLRAFCSNCGSPLYARVVSSSGTVRVRLGSLDTPFEKTGKAHTFVGEMAPWDVIEGYQEIPQFPQWAPKEVLVQFGSKQP